MDLVKITELPPQLGLTSRSIRYYEEAGLIQSVRLPGEKYRFFDEANIERLKQIIVLRKMMVPIKDILRIYESDDMSVVVEVFVHRIQEIDRESAALSELRRITDDFLQTMLKNGIKKISALPLLYEALADQGLEGADAVDGSLSYGELVAASAQLARPVEPSIVQLPAMRTLCSCLKAAPDRSDPEGFWRWLQLHNLAPGEAGCHERFEYQTGAGDVCMVRVPDGFENDSDYLDGAFEGGLFAAVNAYLDEDLSERLRELIAYFDGNKSYEIDYVHGGGLRHAAMLESLLSPDERRELVSLLVPVKKRLAPPELFGQPEELAPGAISLEQLERANPILWTQDVPVDHLIPVNSPHYRVTETGEAEYISWISTRLLSTGVAVRLPFRVDVEFRVGEESGGYGHGRNEGSVRVHHGEDANCLFGVNMNNSPDERLSQEAVSFHQPVFGNLYNYPGRGGILPDAYNRLTWIVGQSHLAVIINGEVRYCGTKFPYMALDLSREPVRLILLGSDSSIKRYFRTIRVSQLASRPRTKIRQGALVMVTKQSNNILPDLRRFITSEFGENYWFNGCARYVMRALGEFSEEPDFGYWFFAGLTGDILAQVYAYGEYMGESVSACRFNREGGGYLERIFEKCGYASTFVSRSQLLGNQEMYIQTLIAYIDKGIPVIAVTHGGPPWGVYVGYEEHGKVLIFLTGDRTEPERVPIGLAISEEDASPHAAQGWLFVGQKRRQVELADVYRDMIAGMPRLLTLKNDAFCLGPEAFRAWAEGIERGKLEGMTPEAFEDGWGAHVSNVCNMATNGSCAFTLLERAQALNPDMSFLADIRKLYARTAQIWNDDGGKDLEALGGGFNVTLHNLQDVEKRTAIAAKIREAAACMDEVLEILNQRL